MVGWARRARRNEREDNSRVERVERVEVFDRIENCLIDGLTDCRIGRVRRGCFRQDLHD